MSITRVVLDTNVVVSAHLTAKGYEALVFDLALASKLQLCVSTDILSEYEDVLRRPRFRLSPQRVSTSLQLIRSKATAVTPNRRVTACLDPDDNRFLECAEAAGADYVVTGNKRHFPKVWRSTAVVNARELIELIATELQP